MTRNQEQRFIAKIFTEHNKRQRDIDSEHRGPSLSRSGCFGEAHHGGDSGATHFDPDHIIHPSIKPLSADPVSVFDAVGEVTCYDYFTHSVEKGVIEARFAKYGPHPTCASCRRVNKCMIPNVPGLVFECRSRYKKRYVRKSNQEVNKRKDNSAVQQSDGTGARVAPTTSITEGE